MKGIFGFGGGLLLACLLGCLPLAAGAREIVVAQSGADTNPGSAEQPYRTLARAAAQASAGDTVTVRAGTYRERLAPVNSGRAGAPIIFQGHAGETVEIDASGQRQGIILYGVSHIVLKGFVVRGSSRSGIHLHDALDLEGKEASYNRIEGVTVRDCGLDGYNGIYVGGHHNTISAATVEGNGLTSVAAAGHGIYVLGNDNRIAGNRINSNARAGIRMEGDRNVICDNLIRQNRDFGITLWVDPPLSGKDTQISNNLLVDNLKGGIGLYGEGGGEKPENITIDHNTVVALRSGFGIRAIGGMQGVKIVSTIISGTFTEAFLYVDSESLTNYVEDHNLFFGSGSFFVADKSYPTFDAFRQLPLAGQHDLWANPELDEQYRPRGASPAVDRGANPGPILPIIQLMQWTSSPAVDRGASCLGGAWWC